MANFNSPEGELTNVFIENPVWIEQFVGNRLWDCGANTYGMLGDNTTTGQSSLVQTVTGGTNWVHVAIGLGHVVALKTDSSLWSWGHNLYGTLGEGGLKTQAHRSSPVQTVSTGTNWTEIAAGQYHTAAIKTDGTLWTWGYNVAGQLGDNSTISKSSPVQVTGGGSNWKQISAGWRHTAAIKSNGTLWLWGTNGDGNLGDNSAINRSSPVQVTTATADWELVSCGNYTTAAIKTDGTLWVWGKNSFGELTVSDKTHRSSPIQTVSGGTNWKQVSCGNNRMAAIKTDGTLWGWGLNTSGEHGDNTLVNKSSPVQTVAGGMNWKSVNCGWSFTGAIKTDGSLWTWGDNSSGQLGDNSTITRSSPVQTVTGGTNWKLVTGGRYNLGAITYSD